MFGNTGAFNPATQSSSFGQTGFGKPISTITGFGAGSTPVFGGNNTSSLFSTKPVGTTSGGLFGNATATPAFGQPVTTQSSFGGFGTSGASTSLFETQQNPNTSIFGTGNTQSTFGPTQKLTGFGFGSSTGTNLFRQAQQQPALQQTTPFGQMNNTANTSLLGTPGGRGIIGTGMVKFNLVTTGIDTMVKNGAIQIISTRHHCIMCMKEYEDKSLEELRLEDYTAGPDAITSTGSTGFGSITSGFGTNNEDY